MADSKIYMFGGFELLDQGFALAFSKISERINLCVKQESDSRLEKIEILFERGLPKMGFILTFGGELDQSKA